jgi:hypothetical protein
MTRTSRARHLHVVESSPHQPEIQEPPTQEPPPSPPAQRAPAEEPTSGASSSEAPQPDSADPDSDDDEQADMDARLTGMSTLLRLALGLMKEYDASPTRRDHRGRRR